MSTQVQRRKGTTVQHATFTGASAELTVDTTKNTVVVHDGATAGGIPLAKETGSAISATSLTLPNGTANAVAFLNGSKVLTSGTALTFDGTTFVAPFVQSSDANASIKADGSGVGGIRMYANNNGTTILETTTNSDLIFRKNSVEGMRLTSTGLGIGTTSPGAKLHVSGSIRAGSTTDYVQLTQYNTNMWGWLCYPVGDYLIRLNTSTGNVGIRVDPDASAALDVQSTTKGVRMPNMTTTQKNAIASPAAGLIIFDTTLAKLCVYTGAAWQTITSA